MNDQLAARTTKSMISPRSLTNDAALTDEVPSQVTLLRYLRCRQTVNTPTDQLTYTEV